MSVVFTLEATTLDRAAWEKVLARWSEPLQGELYDPVQLRPDPASEGSATAFVWGKGSTRAVEIELTPANALELRLPALSSRKDWERAANLLRDAIAAGKGQLLREGEPVGAEVLAPDRVRAAAVDDFCFSARASVEAARGEPFTLPGPYFGVSVLPIELENATPERQAALEEALAGRVERYATSFRSSTLTFKDGRRLATWALIPTLVAGAEYVAVQTEDEGRGAVLRLDRLKAILGSRAEALDGITFLPELDGARDAELIARIKAEHLAAEFPETPRAPGSEGDSLRWKIVSEATRQIFRLLKTKGASPEDFAKVPASVTAALGGAVPEQMVAPVVGLVAKVVACFAAKDLEGAKRVLDESGVPPSQVEPFLDTILKASEEATGVAPGTAPEAKKGCLVFLPLLATLFGSLG
jgi:hypothetical protein